METAGVEPTISSNAIIPMFINIYNGYQKYLNTYLTTLSKLSIVGNFNM